MVDSKKPGGKSKDAASTPEENRQKQNVSSAERAAKAKAFVTAQKEDQKKSEQADYSEANAGTAQQRPRTGLLWFFLLCALGLSGAAGYGVYYLWQQWQLDKSSTQSLEVDVQEAQTAIAAVRDDLRDDGLRDDLTALQAEFGEQSDNRAEELTATKNTLTLLEKTVGRHNRQMQALTQTNRDEWLLAETEYLLRLANQRILMSKEISGPLAMLQSADTILREIDDVSLVPLRRAIADDIAALSRTESVDVDGEYLQLASLTAGIDELKLHDIPEFSNDDADEPVEASMPEQPTLRDSAAKVGGAIKATLGKVFVVRQRDQPMEAMLPPQQELYLRQNLRLMLEQAQLALLARKPDIYQQSLDKAQQWIARYFIAEDAATQAALETLEQARTTNIDPPLPDISGSYRALKEYSDSEYSRKIKADAARQLQQQKKPQAETKAASPAQPDAAQAPELKKKSAPKQEPKPGPEPKSDSGTAEKSKVEAKPKPKQQPSKTTNSEAKPTAKPAQKPEPQVEPEAQPVANESKDNSATTEQPDAGAEEEGADAAREI